MTRNERIASIRARAGNLSQNLDDIAKHQEKPDLSGLSTADLRLYIALMRKGCGCSALANVSILEVTESALTSARHSGYGMALTTFELDRLTQAEQAALDAIRERVIWPQNA